MIAVGAGNLYWSCVARNTDGSDDRPVNGIAESFAVYEQVVQGRRLPHYAVDIGETEDDAQQQQVEEPKQNAEHQKRKEGHDEATESQPREAEQAVHHQKPGRTEVYYNFTVVDPALQSSPLHDQVHDPLLNAREECPSEEASVQAKVMGSEANDETAIVRANRKLLPKSVLPESSVNAAVQQPQLQCGAAVVPTKGSITYATTVMAAATADTEFYVGTPE